MSSLVKALRGWSPGRALRHLQHRRSRFRAVFSTPDGRFVLADLARFCGAMDTSFTPGDSHETAFREGMRNTFLYLAKQLAMTDEELADLAQTLTTSESDQ